MNNPKISVLMAAYNAEKFVKTAVQSILNQTYEDFEFIIINDGSDDKTAEIIRSFTDKRIIFIDNSKNSGLIISLNSGIEIAKGEFIARMDADDESLPERFELQMEFMQKHKNIGVLGTAMTHVENHKSKIWQAPESPQKCLEELLNGVCVWHSTTMIRKSALKNIRYDEKFPNAEDYKLWVDLAKNGVEFANLQEPLFKYNIHGENVSITKSESMIKSARMAQKEYIIYFYGGKFQQEFDLLFSDKASFKQLNSFYRQLNKNQKKHLAKNFRKYVRYNIYSMQFSWNFHPQILIYYFRYKLKLRINKLRYRLKLRTKIKAFLQK